MTRYQFHARHLWIPVIGGVWLIMVWEQGRVVLLERECVEVEERIAVHRQEHAAPDSVPGQRTDEAGKSPSRKYWSDMAAVVASAREDLITEPVMWMGYQLSLREMSAEELHAALDEVAALDLLAADRKRLELDIVAALVEKDPGSALRRFSDRHRDAAWVRTLATGYQKWVEQDAASAVAWFDERVAAGVFDSRSLAVPWSQMRIQCEQGLLVSLMGSSPDLVGRRLSALPESLLSSVFASAYLRLKRPEMQEKFAAMVRGHLPPERHAEVLASQVKVLGRWNYLDNAGAYIGRVASSPQERTACSLEAAKHHLSNGNFYSRPKLERLQEIYDWIGNQGVASQVEVMATVLESHPGRLMNGDPETLQVFMDFHRSVGDDAVLVPLLTSMIRYAYARDHGPAQDAVRRLMEQMQDGPGRDALISAIQNFQQP